MRDGLFGKTLLMRTAAIVAGAAALATAAPGPRLSVAIVVHEGVEVLDFTGPAEAFSAAGYKVFTVGSSTTPVRCHGSVTVVPEYTLSGCPKFDILVVPGGDTDVLTRDPEMMSWIKSSALGATVAMSVCTGAFTFAENGLLDGLKATTHHSAIEALRREAPKVQVVSDQRFVDNGQFVTTAGISAGIDGSLHVISRLSGEDVAWRAARGMEYAWEPPLPEHASATDIQKHDAMRAWVFADWKKASSLYGKIVAENPKDGAAQEHLGESLIKSGNASEGLEHLEKAVALGQDRPATLALLARSQLGAERYPQAIETYKRALAQGLDDHGTSWYNLGCAYALSGAKDDAFKSLNSATDQGFSMRAMAEKDDDLVSLRADPRFAAWLNRLH